MTQKSYNATAIILAGGKSSRLGYDKQLLQIDGTYILDRILETLDPVFKEVIIVSNTPEQHRERHCRIVSDTFVDSGPLGGLHAALDAASHPVCYLTACDMPWINVPYIDYLFDCYGKEPGLEVIVTRFGDMVEPMNGLYAKSLALRIEGLIEGQYRKMTALIDRSESLFIPETTARSYSRDWRMFDNINTPEDWEKFKIIHSGGTAL